MKKFGSKKLGAIGLAIIMLFGIVGSMAYFSDYAVTDASGTAGTVAVALDSNINLLDANGMDILNPGDMRDASFTVTNEGNKSIDVRTTLALTALDREGNAIAFTGDADAQSEFDIYLASDVAMGYLFKDGNGGTYIATEAADMSHTAVGQVGYIPKAGATPIDVKSINGNVITYNVADYSLNGNSDKYGEVETVAGVDAFAHEYAFVVVFKGETGNDWQDSTIKLDVLVEAKQHENTGAGWEVVAQEQVTQGSIIQNAVKGETVITGIDGSVNP